MKIRLIENNPYGYRLDISDPEILELYYRFKRWKKIPYTCPLSDDERHEFEDYILGTKKEGKELELLRPEKAEKENRPAKA